MKLFLTLIICRLKSNKDWLNSGTKQSFSLAFSTLSLSWLYSCWPYTRILYILIGLLVSKKTSPSPKMNRYTLKCLKISGSSKSKNSKMAQNGLKIYLYKLNIEKLWRISDLRNKLYLVKDLIFKLNRQVKFFERSDKMRWNSKSKAKFLLFCNWSVPFFKHPLQWRVASRLWQSRHHHLCPTVLKSDHHRWLPHSQWHRPHVHLQSKKGKNDHLNHRK